jgi:hypothetical protein
LPDVLAFGPGVLRISPLWELLISPVRQPLAVLLLSQDHAGGKLV